MNIEKIIYNSGFITKDEYELIQEKRENPNLYIRLNREESEVAIGKNLVVKHNPNFFDGIREAILYSSLDHPNIIKCLSVDIFDYLPDDPKITTPDNIFKGVRLTFKKYIPCDDPKFAAIIKGNRALIEQILRDILAAMSYLNHFEILHSDIKPGNIFYDPVTDKFLLADFDLATTDRNSFHLRAFSPLTAPPEIHFIKSGVNDWKGDLFSLGVSLATLYTGKQWFPGRNAELYDDFINYIHSLDNPGPEVLTSKLGQLMTEKHQAAVSRLPLNDFLKSILHFDHDKRPELPAYQNSEPLRMSRFINEFCLMFYPKESVSRRESIFLFLLAFSSASLLNVNLQYPHPIPVKGSNVISYDEEGYYLPETLNNLILERFGFDPNIEFTQDELEQIAEHYGEITHEKIISIFFNLKGFKQMT